MTEISWSLLTIGHLSMNKYWGETERKRGPLCTSTLVRTPAGLVLVDPPVMPPQVPSLLNDSAGITPTDIKHVFLTHFHGDHRFGLDAFPHAAWWMGPEEIAFWKEKSAGEETAILGKFKPATDDFLPGLTALPAPGHTPGTTALIFRWRGVWVAITGDAVMTEDFFRATDGFHNSTDMEAARATIRTLAGRTDIIVPGHGNAFLVTLKPEGESTWSGGQPGAGI
jgi:glyoxylase-like metal-dependent hydrolase (beta-lactamase superfamily II)